MNYKQNYIDFIKSRKVKQRAKNDGNIYELHHILPRSLGGTDDDNNLVLLTLREHYIAHYLLWKCTNTHQMATALFFMSNKQKKIISSRQYEKLRKDVIENNSKRVVCLETGEIMFLKQAVIKYMCTDKNISKAAKKVNQTAAGYHWDYYDETIDYTKNEWYGKERIIYATPVIRLEDAKYYKSMKEAGTENGVTDSTISSAIIHKCYANGYHWDCYDETIDYTKNEWYGKKQNLKSSYKKVVCLETGDIFESQQAAARFMGLNKSGPIIRSIKDKKMTFAGYHWDYYDETVDYTKNEWYGGIKSSGRTVVCLETGEIFISLEEAENKYKTKACGLVDCLKGRQKTFAGYHWEDYDKSKDYTKNIYYGKLRAKAHCKKVLCLTTGKIFDSVKEAAESINYNKDSFNAILSYARKNNKVSAKIENKDWKYYEN